MPRRHPNPDRGQRSDVDTRQGLLIFSADTLAAGAAPVEVGEEGVSHGLLQAEALGRVVLHHLLNQVKQLLVVLVLRQHVVLKGTWPLESMDDTCITHSNDNLEATEQRRTCD